MHTHFLSSAFVSIRHLPRHEERYGELTRKKGMQVDKQNLGFGLRSWHYSMDVEDREIKKIFAEDGFEGNCPTDPFEGSDTDTMLEYLKSR